MKAASLKELKTELDDKSHQELIKLCLRLSRFKKENKELLSYLLFESNNEEQYIAEIKSEMDSQFEIINTSSQYFIKKSVQKILRNIKKYIRYSDHVETEIELLLYFCNKLADFTPSIKNNKIVANMFYRELNTITKKIKVVHEDLQHDYTLELKELYL